MTFPWPRGIQAFCDSAIWEQMATRLVGLGLDEEQLSAIRLKLLEGEREVTLAAIRGGEGFRTIWENTGQPRQPEEPAA